MRRSCIIQVRNGGSLYRGRCLWKIDEESVLVYLLERLKAANMWDRIIVSTTAEPIDDEIVEQTKNCGVDIYRHEGDASDILSRHYNALKGNPPDYMVKIFGNTPLVDIDELILLQQAYESGGYDYCYNEHVNGVIYGMGCSVFSFETLEKLAKSKTLRMDQREIGSLYIRQHPEEFKVYKKKSESSWSDYSVLLDQPKDLELIKSITRNVELLTSQNVGQYLEANPLLVEYQTGSNISETGINKLFLFPQKSQAYLNGGDDRAYPVSVELSITDNCNFDCEWCSDSGLRERQNGELSLEVAEKLFQDIAAGGTKGAVIEGGGEPTLHPMFEEIVLAAKNNGLSIGLVTNGSTRLRKEIIALFDWIRISLDASTPDQHQKGKMVQMYESVMKNISAISKYKKEVVLGVGYVVTKDNVDNIEDLLLRLREYNVDYIQFRPVIDHPELSADVDLKYLKKYETAQMQIDIEAMNANKMTGNAGMRCLAHSLSSVITANGSVYLCGRLNIYDWIKPIGDLQKNSFKDIWSGEERARQAMEAANPEFCKEHCPQCRMTKYNMLIDRVKRIKTTNFI